MRHGGVPGVPRPAGSGDAAPLGEAPHEPLEAPGPAPEQTSPVGPAKVLEGRRLRKVYIGGDGGELVVLDGVDIGVAPGEAVAVIGASGAGKSTLLHLLGGLDRPTAGEVILEGRPLAGLPDRQLAAIRNARIGFVFQFHHLLREFSAQENVMMPLLIAGQERAAAERRASDLLAEVGLGGRLHHRPWQLSGGEQQRVAVARALATRPAVVLADEPSGNLDTQTSERLHELFFQLRRDHEVGMVVATHNRELADQADRVLIVREGRLEDFYGA